jgi:rhamnulose-1-phosphate aldolase
LLDIGEMLWNKGWSEANAGNVSVRLPEDLIKEHESLFTSLFPISKAAIFSKAADYAWYLVSATGSRYRDFRKSLFESFVIVGIVKSEVYDNSFSDEVVFPCHRKPTSEWATHSMIQQWLMLNRPKDRVILHAHPTDWIVIGSLPEYRDDKNGLAKRIRSGLPELDIYFPGGFALLPYAAPGSLELANQTLPAMVGSNVVIWERHGILVTAECVDIAFDYLEIVSKAAEVYLEVRCQKFPR